MTLLGLFGAQNAFQYEPRFIKRHKSSQVKWKDIKETEKGKESSNKMIFEKISIAFHSLKTYTVQNSGAKYSIDIHGSLKNLKVGIGN